MAIDTSAFRLLESKVGRDLHPTANRAAPSSVRFESDAFRQMIRSPCIVYCQKDKEGVCQGCFRTIEEIKSWPFITDEFRQAILIDCEERIANLPPEYRKLVNERRFCLRQSLSPSSDK